MVTDAAFANLVADWRSRLSEIDETAPAIAPSPELWRDIESALDAPQSVANVPVARPDFADRFAVIWRNLAFWRLASGVTAAAAVVLGVGLGLSEMRNAEAPRLVAVLMNDQAQAQAMVEVRDDGSVRLIPMAEIAAPQGRSLQVWTLQDRAQGPRSVGLLDRARTAALVLQGLARPAEGHLFEITLEPAGGSPTGRPTGPILMKGLAARTF
jgi:anti-sigma-K factor RskA